MAISSSPPKAHVDYPSEEGQPIAESDFQREPLTYAVEALGAYFQQRADVYVSGNPFIYYEEGHPNVVPMRFAVCRSMSNTIRRVITSDHRCAACLW